MSKGIEVRIGGRGRVVGGEVEESERTRAACSLCGVEVEAVASVGAPDAAAFACAGCLRERLDALSVARYRLRGPGAGLPWGKVSG